MEEKILKAKSGMAALLITSLIYIAYLLLVIFAAIQLSIASNFTTGSSLVV